MDLADKYFREYTVLQPSTTEKKVIELECRMDVVLPKDLKDFLLQKNGVEGFIGSNYLRLCALEEIEEYTKGYCSINYLDKICIGSNGGGELFLINRSKGTQQYGIVPGIGDEKDYINLSFTLEGLFERLRLDKIYES